MFLLLYFLLNDPATTEIYTLSLHDALPICLRRTRGDDPAVVQDDHPPREHKRLFLIVGDEQGEALDRKSTRLNSSHANISYAVFCLKKKKQNIEKIEIQSQREK